MAKYFQPAYFQTLRLKNFRGFRSSRNISLAPLTFLVGPNSSGKSSIFDAFLFLIQSRLLNESYPGAVPSLAWIGGLVDLGSYNDTVFRHDSSQPLTISATVSIKQTGSMGKGRIELSAGYPITFEYRFSSKQNDPAGRLRELIIRDGKSGVAVTARLSAKTNQLTSISTKHRTASGPFKYGPFSWLEIIGRTLARQTGQKSYPVAKGERAGWNRIANILADVGLYLFAGTTQRVSSGRSAPKRWYPTTEGDEAQKIYGMGGLFDNVSPAHIRAIEGGSRARAFPFFPSQAADIADVNKELKKLGIASKITAENLSAYHSTLEVTDSKTRVKSKLIEVGYGASQVLPVILACHSANISPLFIEQPEIHLHPKGQAVIADLICETSKRRQVIVETHSEHLINRARLLVADGRLRRQDVAINYIDRTKNGSTAVPIRIGPKGQFLDEWPDGFFDERFQDTLALAQLASK